MIPRVVSATYNFALARRFRGARWRSPLRPTLKLAWNTMWGFPKVSRTSLGGPHNEDCSILGFILGYPISGNYHVGPLYQDCSLQRALCCSDVRQQISEPQCLEYIIS